MADGSATLQWQGRGLVFRGGPDGGVETIVDGDGREGISPVQLLVLALAGCMGADIVDIVKKSRVPIEALTVRIEVDRAPQPPRRLTRVRLKFTTSGVSDADAGKLDRALELSRTTYCSVLHTLRPDVEVTFELERR